MICFFVVFLHCFGLHQPAFFLLLQMLCLFMYAHTHVMILHNLLVNLYIIKNYYYW